ncbi:MAG: tyrosine-type recombinase/integrase [bacterium]
MQYRKDLERKLIKDLRKFQKNLPPLCSSFFISISNTTSIKTRIGYACDLRLFFDFLISDIEAFENLQVKNISAYHLNQLTYYDIELFLDYTSYHERTKKTKKGEEVTVTYINSGNGKARKLSSIKRLFAYLYKSNQISSNPAELVETPKIKTKSITYLEKDEIKQLLDEVENGEKLVGREVNYHNINKNRDLAIISLLLGTGIRLSECVQININDIDFKNKTIRIIRKGGNESVVYFGEEVNTALRNYLEEREDIKEVQGHEEALFLSLQKKRISNRSVQKLVQKYSERVTPSKNISPHKLRSTYGTALYEKTEDIYLVADALGHADINTTKKHYAKIHENRRKKAAEVTRLRED